MTEPATTDPVLAQRARIARLTGLAKQLGYGLVSIAVVLFFVGFAVDFTPLLVTLIMTSLIIGFVLLAPAIVFGFGVRAADRADRDGTW